MKPVIEGGYVYIAQPPLYKVQKGKKIAYAYKEQESQHQYTNMTTIDIGIGHNNNLVIT